MLKRNGKPTEGGSGFVLDVVTRPEGRPSEEGPRDEGAGLAGRGWAWG